MTDHSQPPVESADVLDSELGTQKSLGINRLNELAAPVRSNSIQAAVNRCLREAHDDG